jgi:hypothetical protein
MKKTKLIEKPSRIPDISEQNISQKFKEYIDLISQLNNEAAKAQRFLIFLKDVFGDVNAGFIEDYLHGVEKYVSVKNKDILLKGRIDTLYGNLIIEFEKDLQKTLDEACDQLKGPNGKIVIFRSIWIILEGEDIPRLITIYPEGGRHEI